MKCYVLTYHVKLYVGLCDDCCVHDTYMKYVMDEKIKGNEVNVNVMLWMKNMKTSCMYVCMYVCHVHRDTSPLCCVSTDSYIRYLCSPWYHASFSFSMASDDVLTCYAQPSQAQVVRIWARMVGPCARMWAVCGEVPHIQPWRKLKRA